MKKYIWKLCTRAWPEGQILPFWGLVVRAILYPLDTFYWQMSKSRGYDRQSNTWNIEGCKWSGVSLRYMANAQGVIFKITTTNGITTLQAVQPEPVEPHAELKAMYEHQVKDGTLDNYVWEYKFHLSKEFVPLDGSVVAHGQLLTYADHEYRCTPKPPRRAPPPLVWPDLECVHKKIEGVDHDPYYEPVELQPDPVLETVLRSDFDFLLHDKQRAVKLIEEAYELLAEGKIFEAKDLLEKRVNNRIVNIPVFIAPTSTEGK